MSSTKPVLLFLHGAYHPPICYSGLTTKLEAAGFEVVMPQLASLGHGKVKVSLDDDIAGARKEADTLLESGKEVVLVGHSFGGFIAMNVANGLSIAELKARGKSGGIKSIVYISATLPVKQGEGSLDACTPIPPSDLTDIFDVEILDGEIFAKMRKSESALEYFFNPAPREEAEKVMTLLEPQCTGVFSTPSPALPSDLSVPQTYIISEKDNTVPLERQEQAVALAGMKSVRFPSSGHAPFLAHAQEVADAIIEAALA